MCNADKKKLLTKMIVSVLAVGYCFYNLSGQCYAEESKEPTQEYDNEIISKQIYGGKDDDAHDSYIVVKNKSEVNASIFGGYTLSSSADISNNRIDIDNSSVASVTGGYGSNRNLIKDNTVNLNGSTVKGAQIIGGLMGFNSGGIIEFGIDNSDTKGIQNNTVHINDSNINITSNPSGGNILGGFSQAGDDVNIDNNGVILEGKINIQGNQTVDIYGASSIKGESMKENYVRILSDAVIDNSTTLNIGGANNTIGTQTSTIGGNVENNYVQIAGEIKRNANIYAGYSKPYAKTNTTIRNNYIELDKGAVLEKASLYGHNTSSSTNFTAENNNLILNNWGGKVQKAANFENLNFENLAFDDETYNGVTEAVFSTSSQSNLNDTNININSFADSVDLNADDTKYIIIDGKNISFDPDKVEASNKVNDEIAKDMINDDKNENSNGIRIHGVKIYTDDANKDKDNKNDVYLRIEKSILTGKYIDKNGAEHYNSKSTEGNRGTLFLDDTISTNADIIAGSYASGSNAAEGGKVTIKGNYDGTVYAGYSEKGEINGNTITVNSNVNARNLVLLGKNTTSGNDNNLDVNGKNVVVGSVKNFDNINLNDIEWEDKGTVLTIDNGKDSKLSNTNINVNSLNLQGGKPLKVNDSMNLVYGKNLDIKDDKVKFNKDFTAGVATVGKGEAIVNDDGLSYKITGLAVNPQTNLIAENRAVATAFINQGSDLIASGLDSLHDQYGYGFKTFAAVYGNRSTYDAGADLKINGWSEIIGLGSTKRINDGDLDWGVFYENGSGNYRTYNQFNDEFFRGDGSMVYNGGGAAARFTRDNGWYYEGSLRAGTLKSEIDHALKDGMGNTYGYKSDTTYYGAHLGVGKITPLSDSQDLNVYGKFFHTYNDGDDFTIAGDRFSFDSVTSDRIMLGAKITTNKDNIWQTHYGLAWEYEFNGDSDMTAGQFDLPTQSLKGSTFIGEIGFSYRDDKLSPWSFDLDFKGYQGQRDGFSGHAQVTYNF